VLSWYITSLQRLIFMLPSFMKKRGKLQPVWRYTSEGAIWRVVVTPAGRLIGESRDLEKKETCFFCVDVLTGAPLWERATFGEQWWIGIEAVHDEVVFLHKYATPSLPEHKSIIAVDAGTGGVLWSSEDLKFEFLVEDGLIASRNSVYGRTYHHLDARDGTVKRDVAESEALALRRMAPSGERDDLRMPDILGFSAEETAGLSRVIGAQCSREKVVGDVAFLEHGAAVIFTYHERGSYPAAVHCCLKIAERTTGRLLFESRLNTDAPSVASASFFVHDNTLMYVSEHTTLTAVDLTDLNLS
jgi:hypothetical protein